MSLFLWFRLQSLQKVLIWAHFVFHQSNICSKNQNLMLISNPSKNCQKCEKVIKKWWKNGVFYSYYYMQKYYAYNFFEWMIFFQLFLMIRNPHQMRFLIPILNLCSKKLLYHIWIFANFEAKNRTKRIKKPNMYFSKVS